MRGLLVVLGLAAGVVGCEEKAAEVEAEAPPACGRVHSYDDPPYFTVEGGHVVWTWTECFDTTTTDGGRRYCVSRNDEDNGKPCQSKDDCLHHCEPGHPEYYRCSCG